MQQDKTDIFGVSRIWVLSSLFCLLPPGCILTGFRNFSTFPLFSEIPLGCNQDAAGETMTTRLKSFRPKTYHPFLRHPGSILTGFRKKSGKVKHSRNPVRMPPGCNRKNNDDKTQLLQTPEISIFSCCILIASSRDCEKSGKAEQLRTLVGMQQECNRKNNADMTQILQTPKISLFSFCILVAN